MAEDIVNAIRRATADKSGDDKLILGIRSILRKNSGKSVEEQLTALSKPIRLIRNRIDTIQKGLDKLVDASATMIQDLSKYNGWYKEFDFKSTIPFEDQVSRIDMTIYHDNPPAPYKWDATIEPKIARALAALGNAINIVNYMKQNGEDPADISRMEAKIPTIEKYLDLIHRAQNDQIKNFDARTKEIQEWNDKQDKEIKLQDKFRTLHRAYIAGVNKRDFYNNALQLALSDQAVYNFIINNKDTKGPDGKLIKKIFDIENQKDLDRWVLPPYDPNLTNLEIRQAQKTQGLIPGNLPGNEDIEGPVIDEEGNRTTEKMYQLVGPNYYNPRVSTLGPERVPTNAVPGLERVDNADIDDTHPGYEKPVDVTDINESGKGTSDIKQENLDIDNPIPAKPDEFSAEDPYRDYYDQNDRGYDTEAPAVRNSWIFDPATNQFVNVQDLENIPQHLRNKVTVDTSPNVDTIDYKAIPGVDNLPDEEPSEEPSDEGYDEALDEAIPEDQDVPTITEDDIPDIQEPIDEEEESEDEEDKDDTGRQVASIRDLDKWRKKIKSRIRNSLEKGGKVA